MLATGLSNSPLEGPGSLFTVTVAVPQHWDSNDHKHGTQLMWMILHR